MIPNSRRLTINRIAKFIGIFLFLKGLPKEINDNESWVGLALSLLHYHL